MPQEQIITVTILGQKKQLLKQDFLSFMPLISIQQVNGLLTPHSKFYEKFSSQRNKVLNILLYYVMSVQLNFEVLQKDSLGDNYRTLCIKQITHYYLKNHMNIQLREFSFLTSKILGLKLHQSAHIIFYLIYGRFASHAFINYVCYHQQNPFTNNYSKSRTGFQFNRNSKKKSRASTNNQLLSQIKVFCKELRQTLHSQKTLCNSNSHLTQNIVNYNLKEEKIYEQIFAQRKQLNLDSKYNTFVPVTIKKAQNTFILQNLSFQRTHQNFRHLGRKGLMRKQKFNDFFNANEMRQQIKLKNKINKLGKQKMNTQIKRIDLNLLEIGMCTVADIQKIAEKLKVESNELDYVRQNSKRNQFMIKQNEKAKKQQQTLHKQNTQKLLSIKNCTNKEIKQNIDDNFNFSISKKSLLNSQTAQRNLQKQFNSDQYSNLLRIQETNKENQRLKHKPNQFYLKTFAGMKKINYKQRIKLYKHQHKKFFQLQFNFDKIRQST